MIEMTIDTITVEFSNWVIWNKHHDAKGTFKSIGPRTSLMKQKFYITEKNNDVPGTEPTQECTTMLLRNKLAFCNLIRIAQMSNCFLHP